MPKLAAVPLLLLALSAASCQQAPSRSSDLTDHLRTLQGQKVRVYLGGTFDASHSGKLAGVDGDAQLITLEMEYRGVSGEKTTRGRKVIRIDRILAVAIEELP